MPLYRIVLMVILSCSLLKAASQKQGRWIKKEKNASSIIIKLDTSVQGNKIPDDFNGLSFETGSIRKGNAGVAGYFFSPDNKQVVNLFQQIGIKNLRIGGGSLDFNATEPTFTGIDQLFAFAKAARVKVIYSLRLLQGNDSLNAAIAKYIWDKYKPYLHSFAIGNEPDWKSYHRTDPEITDYPTFHAKWQRFANAIRKAVPGATFVGPDTGSNFPVPNATNTDYDHTSWTVNFANDEKGSGRIAEIALHNYVGQNAPGNSIAQMVEKMLSPLWNAAYYPILYQSTISPVLEDKFTYRLTESNSFSGEVAGGSNCFATALFALDYMHWWAEHNCAGVDFHNKQWVKNAPINKDSLGNFYVCPIGYGIKAFDISGHGRVLPLSVSKQEALNLTSYGVNDSGTIYITLINKTYGVAAKAAQVEIISPVISKKATILFLNAPNGDVTATSGIQLGKAGLQNNIPWQGQWEKVKNTYHGRCQIIVPAGSAAIIKIN